MYVCTYTYKNFILLPASAPCPRSPSPATYIEYSWPQVCWRVRVSGLGSTNTHEYLSDLYWVLHTAIQGPTGILTIDSVIFHWILLVQLLYFAIVVSLMAQTSHIYSIYMYLRSTYLCICILLVSTCKVHTHLLVEYEVWVQAHSQVLILASVHSFYSLLGPESWGVDKGPMDSTEVQQSGPESRRADEGAEGRCTVR